MQEENKDIRKQGRQDARNNLGRVKQKEFISSVVKDFKARDLAQGKQDLRTALDYARGRSDVAISKAKKAAKENKKPITVGAISTLTLTGLGLAKRKSIASHIRNIQGKAVRVKGSGLPKPKKINKKTGVVDVYSETLEKSDVDKSIKQIRSGNKSDNTKRTQQRLAYLEKESPYIKLTKDKRERAREIKRVMSNSNRQYPFAKGFIGLIEFGHRRIKRKY